MRFKITAAREQYHLGDKRIEKLKEYGFEFKLLPAGQYYQFERVPMERDITTLDELLAWCKVDGSIIVELDPPTITIYNDYVE